MHLQKTLSYNLGFTIQKKKETMQPLSSPESIFNTFSWNEISVLNMPLKIVELPYQFVGFN